MSKTIEKYLIKKLIKELEKVEKQLPDDAWDEHHWKGVKAGLIRAINTISSKEFNYNFNSKELKYIFDV